MRLLGFLKEAGVFLAIAFLCAVGSNYLAANERKLTWIGTYLNALTLPPRQAESVSANPPAVTSTPSTAPMFETKETTPKQTQPALEKKKEQTTAPMAAARNELLPHPDRAWIEVSSDDALELFGSGALILDARRSEDFSQGHIAGARSLAVWEADIDLKVQSLPQQVSPVGTILVYCSGGNCEDSRMLAEKLFAAGFTNVWVYKDGFPDWQAKGRPVETGASN